MGGRASVEVGGAQMWEAQPPWVSACADVGSDKVPGEVRVCPGGSRQRWGPRMEAGRSHVEAGAGRGSGGCRGAGRRARCSLWTRKLHFPQASLLLAGAHRTAAPSGNQSLRLSLHHPGDAFYPPRPIVTCARCSALVAVAQGASPRRPQTATAPRPVLHCGNPPRPKDQRTDRVQAGESLRATRVGRIWTL